MLASTLSRPRCGMPMTTSSRPASAAEVRTSSSSGMTDSPPSSENRFCPTYLVCRNVSNASAALSRRRIVQLLLAGRLRAADLDPLLDPLPLLRVLDVHVLDADPAAVGVAQHAEDVAQAGHRLAAEAPGGELAVQVPQRQAVGDDVEVGVAALAVLQRVGVGHQVAAHPVGVDQLLHPGLLGDVVLVRGGDVADPADRLVRDAQRAEDLVVEAVLAEQQLVDPAQEVAGLRALDDPVVVGRGQRHDLADRQPGQRLGGRALVLGRVLHRADADDRALAGHQPRHRVDGADGARVGEADRGAGEVVGGQLVAAGAPDDVLVRRPEAGEVHRVRALDRRAPAGCASRPASAGRWPGRG